MKLSGSIRDVDYSHGTILFYDFKTNSEYTCTWSGILPDNCIGAFIVAEGSSIESFEDASSYEPNSARLISISTMQAVIPIKTIG